MKKDLKKDLTLKKAMEALEKQALRDDETKDIKGGFPGPIIYGMWIP